MDERKNRERGRGPEELIQAFDRERSAARDHRRRHDELVRDSHARDRQVFIERRRRPR
jgi:hypothetical protein